MILLKTTVQETFCKSWLGKTFYRIFKILQFFRNFIGKYFCVCFFMLFNYCSRFLLDEYCKEDSKQTHKSDEEKVTSKHFECPEHTFQQRCCHFHERRWQKEYQQSFPDRN